MAHATIPEALRAGRSASYLVLLRMGFGMRARSLARRWALTPPFHPYPFGRCIFCATFRGSPRAAVSGHPALRSPDFPLPIKVKRSPDSLRRCESSIFWDGTPLVVCVIQSRRGEESRQQCRSGQLAGFFAEPVLSEVEGL